MELQKLSEDALNRQPEDVFDIVTKLGEGSYGSVYKSIHKESRQVLAIKQVPVDTDLQEIIKEISIMQQCDSPYVVKYYGSYFKNTDLWIVMEYCGAGSVLDIMKLRGLSLGLPKGEVKTLTEVEIATVLSDTLKGLEYLHVRKKIHRDIKAGNILLNSEGHAKLADFGVAGQLTDTMAKRNTVIGTPFWMAPEVIQEIGYDCVADIWSLGITSLEMAEGKAPYGEIHPMRAIFMIPTKPPPSFQEPDKWSSQFIDFVSRCLVKKSEERATASELLQHDFIKNAKSPEILAQMISEAQQMRDQLQDRAFADDDGGESRTMIPGGMDDGTLVRNATLTEDDDSGGTMICHSSQASSTLKPSAPAPPSSSSGGGVAADEGGTMVNTQTLTSNLGTMVINEDEDDTMKRHNTGSGKGYKPEFMAHFEKKENNKSESKVDPSSSSNEESASDATPNQDPSRPKTDAAVDQGLQHRLAQIAGGQPLLQNQAPVPSSNSYVIAGPNNTTPGVPAVDQAKSQFQRSIADGDLDFLKFLSFDELKNKMGTLDQDMEREIDDLRRRYHAKRQPILDAMDQKRKRQQNF